MKNSEGATVAQRVLDSWHPYASGGSRDEWAAVPINRGDTLAVPGVYMIWGWQADSLCVYVGQTDAVSFRIRDHRKKRRWVEFAIAVVSRKSPFDRSLLRVLEIELQRSLHQSSRDGHCVLEHATQELPIPLTDFLGSDRHRAALELSHNIKALCADLAPQVDPKNGPIVRLALLGHSTVTTHVGVP